MLSQTCEYALRAVACLAQRPGEFVTAGDLAESTSVPADYLSKVLQQLAGAKVVYGRRGVGGGYRLARAPEEITFHDIIDAMGVISRLRACPTHDDESRGLCPLHKTVDRALEAAEDVFRNTTLADLVNDESNDPLCVDTQPAKHRAEHAAPETDAKPAQEASEAPSASPAPEDAAQRYTASGNLKARPRRPSAD